MKTSDRQKSIRICVFCGARPGDNKIYTETAAQLGSEIAKIGACLTYGGGRLGLMGSVADSVLKAGGRILGVFPAFLGEHLVLEDKQAEHILVDDLLQRKALLIKHSDAFVALPGGLGTLDELIEVLTWRQLRQLNKPIGLLNTNDYFSPILGVFEHIVAKGFLKKNELDGLVVEPNPKILIKKITRLIEENEKIDFF